MTAVKANEHTGRIITEGGVMDNNSSLRVIIEKRKITG